MSIVFLKSDIKILLYGFHIICMSDILLSKKKQNRFTNVIEQKILQTIGVDCSVLVTADGDVNITSTANQRRSLSENELSDVLAGLELTFESSSYQVTAEHIEDIVIGYQFNIKRDGW